MMTTNLFSDGGEECTITVMGHTLVGGDLAERAARIRRCEMRRMRIRDAALGRGLDPDIAEEADEYGVSYDEVAENYRRASDRAAASRSRRESALRESAEEWRERRRQCEPIPDGAAEMQIGAVQWEFHAPGAIHTVDGSRGVSPRWVRVMAARQWPDAGGIQLVRVRIMCREIDHDVYGHAPRGITSILLDLSPDRMGIPADTMCDRAY